MQVKITVVPMPDGTYDLVTGRGHRVGPRLLTVKPAVGESYPDATARYYTDRDEAYAAAMALNLYLKHAWEHRQKDIKDRGRE